MPIISTILSSATRKQVGAMAPARLVVGIPSYRNPTTVATVTQAVLDGLAAHYGALRPVLVHIDGHSLDRTLDIAGALPLPPEVRRVTTRYRGLPGKGSALCALFVIATMLGAEAVVVVEADSIAFDGASLAALLDPVLSGTADVALARYAAVSPLPAAADLLLRPLLAALFSLSLRYPTAGEIALRGHVARGLASRDVWETDVARSGVGIWMVTQLALEPTRFGEVALPTKIHESTLSEGRFVQEVGTLFRMAGLHGRAWQQRPPAVRQWGAEGARPQRLVPASGAVREEAAPYGGLDGGAPSPAIVWAQRVYDALLLYNLGDGDPDKAVAALYPTFLRHYAAWLARAERSAEPQAAWEEIAADHLAAFEASFHPFAARWARGAPML